MHKDIQKNNKNNNKKNPYYSNNKHKEYQQYNYWQGRNNYNPFHTKTNNNNTTTDYNYYRTKTQWHTQPKRELDDEDILRHLNTYNTQYRQLQREEALRVNIVLKQETKEIIIYKGDDVGVVAMNFCNENNLPSHLIKPLSEKLKVSLESINAIVNNNLGDKDVHILQTIKRIYNDEYYNDGSIC